MASSNSANKLMLQMQKIASKAQVDIQKIANQATEKSFEFNREEANTARQWQTEMSNTAHQREVADLKKAGLNPVLSANSGAQSYTTSAASAQANDPSGSIGSLAGDLIQSRTSAYQADTSAAATRQAAKQTAAATRYAAMQSAQAQKYAATMAYQNQREHEKWQTEYMKEEYKQKINLANSTPSKSVGGVLDKIAQKSGLYELIGTKSVKNVVNTMKNFLNEPSKYYKEAKNGVITSRNFVLNSNGIKTVNGVLNKFHVNPTSTTRNLFIRAVVFRDPVAATKFISYIPKKSNHKFKGMQM